MARVVEDCAHVALACVACGQGCCRLGTPRCLLTLAEASPVGSLLHYPPTVCVLLSDWLYLYGHVFVSVCELLIFVYLCVPVCCVGLTDYGRTLSKIFV